MNFYNNQYSIWLDFIPLFLLYALVMLLICTILLNEEVIVMSKTVRYYVDGSNLSTEEFKKLEDLFYKTSFLCNEDVRRPRCFVSIWQEDLPPNKLFKLPIGCLIYRIQQTTHIISPSFSLVVASFFEQMHNQKQLSFPKSSFSLIQSKSHIFFEKSIMNDTRRFGQWGNIQFLQI